MTSNFPSFLDFESIMEVVGTGMINGEVSQICHICHLLSFLDSRSQPRGISGILQYVI